jgi:moderate conductance mechanosensitive channel
MMEEIISLQYWLDLLNKISNWFLTTLPSLLFLFLFLFVALKLVRFLIKRLKYFLIRRAKNFESVDIQEAEKRINTLMGILWAIGRIFIWSTVIIVFLKKIGIDIGPILAGAGVLGLAIGFGSQELVRDFISGFFLLLENQVRTGDVATINGTTGLVEKIELRTITMRDFSGTVHIFQNGKINSLSNLTKEWSAIVFDIGVAYKEDVDRVIHVMKDVGDLLMTDEEFGENILEPIDVVGLEQFADSAVVIRARLKTKPNSQWSLGREYRKRLKKAFDDEGIEIPFPHATIYWGENSNPFKVNGEEK